MGDGVGTDSGDCTTDCAYKIVIGSGPGGRFPEADAQEPSYLGVGCFAVSGVESVVVSCITFAALVAVCLVGFFDERIGVDQCCLVMDNSF